MFAEASTSSLVLLYSSKATVSLSFGELASEGDFKEDLPEGVEGKDGAHTIFAGKTKSVPRAASSFSDLR